MKCSVPDSYKSNWNFWWYRDDQKLTYAGETLTLWNVGVKEDGSYTCKGVRDSAVGNIYTIESLPLEINVDGKIFIVVCIIEKNQRFACQVLFFFRCTVFSLNCSENSYDASWTFEFRNIDDLASFDLGVIIVTLLCVIFVQVGGLSCESHMSLPLLDNP